MGTSGPAAQRFQGLANRVRIMWIGSLVGFPLVAWLGYGVASFTGGFPPEGFFAIPPELGLGSLLAVAAVLLLVSRFVVARLLDPIALARIPRTTAPSAPDSQRAIEARVATRSLTALAILDVPVYAGIVLAMLAVDPNYFLIALGYGVLVTLLALPDSARIAAETEQRMQRNP